jgi:hypothetical protein
MALRVNATLKGVRWLSILSNVLLMCSLIRFSGIVADYQWPQTGLRSPETWSPARQAGLSETPCGRPRPNDPGVLPPPRPGTPSVAESAVVGVVCCGAPSTTLPSTAYKTATVLVEQVGAPPGQGPSSMFRSGQAYGTILGVIGALTIPSATCRRRSGKGRLDSTTRPRHPGDAIETGPAGRRDFTRSA